MENYSIIETTETITDEYNDSYTTARKAIPQDAVKLGWGQGKTDPFMEIVDGKPVLLDYEKNFANIHAILGGALTYTSQTCLTGEGWVPNLGELIRLGLYRVDTKRPFIVRQLNELELEIFIPYKNHGEDQEELLQKYPVVLRYKHQVVYCHWEKILEVLRDLRKSQVEEQRRYVRTFIACDGHEEIEQLLFTNLFGEVQLYPWNFFGAWLEPYKLEPSNEKVWKLYQIGQLPNGQLVRTALIGNEHYAVELLDKDPAEAGETAPKGWTMALPRVMYKINTYGSAYAVAWEPTNVEEVFQRVAKWLPEEKRDAFIACAKRRHKYVYTENSFWAKLDFLFDKEKILSELQQGVRKWRSEYLAQAVRQALKDIAD